MIEREYGEMTIVCDSTGTRYRRSYEHDDFDRMIADAKSDGWLIKLERGNWRHYSPESKSVFAEFEAMDGVD